MLVSLGLTEGAGTGGFLLYSPVKDILRWKAEGGKKEKLPARLGPAVFS